MYQSHRHHYKKWIKRCKKNNINTTQEYNIVNHIYESGHISTSSIVIETNAFTHCKTTPQYKYPTQFTQMHVQKKVSGPNRKKVNGTII
jgi:ArsR family metal-binding transcriptional regulator